MNLSTKQVDMLFVSVTTGLVILAMLLLGEIYLSFGMAMGTIVGLYYIHITQHEYFNPSTNGNTS